MTAAVPVSRSAVERRVITAILGQPIIGNTARGLVVEAMIAEALAPAGWIWVGADWASWDFEHSESWMTIEVKQSAALQTWSKHYPHAARPRFDIGKRSGYWYQAQGSDAPEWHEERCRPADIYIFAWHGDTSPAADQRQADDWTFHVVPTAQLPNEARSISLEKVKALSEAYGLNELHMKLVEAKVAKVVGVPRQRRQ